MDAKWKGTMATVMGVLAIPLAGALLYGMYFVFTYKAKPRMPEPKIEQFRADGKQKEGKRKPGDPQVWDVQLFWEVSNVTDISIEPGVGKVEPKGERHVELEKDTTYVLKAKNESGEVTYSLDVNIAPPEKPEKP